jgi:hypothetical protein
MSWLFDDPSGVFVVLSVATLGFAAAWWTTRKPRYVIALAVVAGLFLLVWLLSTLIDTDSKQIQRALDEMTAAVKDRKPEKILWHISDDFQLDGRISKSSFGKLAEKYMQSGEVEAVAVWSLDVHDLSKAERKATVTFKAKPRGNVFRGNEVFNVKALFVLEPDGQWRLKDFKLYLPTVDPFQGDPLSFPF